MPPGAAEEIRSLGASSRRIAGGPVDLHALDYGGDKPPLLVLPGITSPAITWDFVVAPLRALVRPVVLDLRGRGLSATGPSYTLEDYAADAEATVRDLGLNAPIVLGHSLGARIAAAVAARGAVPIEASVLVDPPLSGPGRGEYPTSREAFQAQLREALDGTTADEVARHYPRWSRPELALRARWLPSCDETAVLETHARFNQEDFFDWWPRVPAPVALVRGGASPVVTPDGAREAAERNPAAIDIAVPDAGHMVPWDSYAAFIAEIRSLLETVLARRASD